VEEEEKEEEEEEEKEEEEEEERKKEEEEKEEVKNEEEEKRKKKNLSRSVAWLLTHDVSKEGSYAIFKDQRLPGNFKFLNIWFSNTHEFLEWPKEH
jgi:hypothetical protein